LKSSRVYYTSKARLQAIRKNQNLEVKNQNELFSLVSDWGLTVGSQDFSLGGDFQ